MVVKLFLPESDQGGDSYLFQPPMSPDSDKRRLSKSKLLGMFDGWEINRSTDEQEIDFLCLRDDDYVKNRLEFIPKHCLIFADYSPEPAIYTQGE